MAFGEGADVEECIGLFGFEDLHRRDLTCAMVSSNGVVTLGPGKLCTPDDLAENTGGGGHCGTQFS
jgi:hypothetical protein